MIFKHNTKWCFKTTQRCQLQWPSIVPKDSARQIYIIFKGPTLSSFRNKTSTIPKPHFLNPMTQTHKTNWGVEPRSPSHHCLASHITMVTHYGGPGMKPPLCDVNLHKRACQPPPPYRSQHSCWYYWACHPLWQAPICHNTTISHFRISSFLILV